MKKEVLVTGSYAFDYIMDFPGELAPNLTPSAQGRVSMSFLIDKLVKQRGGTAGNISYNLSLLKQPVSVLGTAGSDFEQERKFYQESGINTEGLKILDGVLTASAFIVTDKVDSQIIFFYTGAMSRASEFQIRQLSKKPDYVVISANDVKAMERLADECRDSGFPFMADIGMQLPRLNKGQIRKIITGSDVLIVNDSEMELLKKKTGFTQKDLLSEAKIIITTFGPEGSVIATVKQETRIEAAIPEEVKDPTGAGDAYRAGFLAGYLRDLDLKTCGQMGSVASCYAIEKYGTTNHGFTIDEFCKRYYQNFDEELKF